MPSIARIQEIVKPIVDSKGAYLVDVAIRHEGRGSVVEIFADTDQGITTELCAEISRDLSHVFDRDDLFPGRYYLVVSSPGIDRPLKFQRQYLKNIGRNLTVKYRVDQRAERVEGDLIETNEDGIVIQLEGDETRQVAFDAIIEARVNTIW
jgi:ribosome maturation factor RimP